MDSALHHALMVGGKFRPAVECMFATQVMYFNERMKAGEMRKVGILLKEALAHAEVASLMTAEATSERWSKAVMQRFELDNLHLSTRLSNGAQNQLEHAIQMLSAAGGKHRRTRPGRVNDGERELYHSFHGGSRARGRGA